jgi:hypothetical protein
MSTADSAGPSLNGATAFRRLLFFLILILLSLYYLMVQFQGLSDPRGMEQASIGRELARNNGFKSKVLRPVSIWQSEKANDGKTTLLEASRDTYHSPLHPILLAAIFTAVNGDDADQWRMREEHTIYQLDRVIAAVSVFCFLMAIGVNYFLICRIFDNKIAGVVALLMLLCDLNWQFSLSGLPQMLMLLLFSCATFFAYRAVENTEGGGGIALTPALIAGVFFGLLCLTHWITIWIVFGFVIYAAFFMRPKGVAGVATLIVVTLFALFPLLKNAEYSGSPGGTAFLAIFNGLTGMEDYVMRGYDLGDSYLPLQNLPFAILKASFLQANGLYASMGSIPTAPIFFIALLHPFKRPSIASFRWCLLLMWVFAVFGMSIFGLGDDPAHSNQLHILFAPLMAAYGLAFVAIIWSRVKIPEDLAILRNAHLFIIVILSAGPLIMGLPSGIRQGLSSKTRSPHWPPYFPSALNLQLASLTLENEIVVSDQPWAVAWYADRTSLWLPRDTIILSKIKEMADEENTPIAGIMISPYSSGLDPLLSNFGQYSKFGPLILDGWASIALGQRRFGALASQSREMKTLLHDYPHPVPFYGAYLVYWSAEPVYDNGNR